MIPPAYGRNNSASVTNTNEYEYEGEKKLIGIRGVCSPSSELLGHMAAQIKKLRESLAHLVNDFCRMSLVPQAAIANCFPFDQNGLASPEVDVGGRYVADALMTPRVIVFGDEGLYLGFEIAGEVVVLKQDAVFGYLMPVTHLH